MAKTKAIPLTAAAWQRETEWMVGQYADGKTLREIGESVGISAQAVHSRLRKAGVVSRPPGVTSRLRRMSAHGDRKAKHYVRKG